MTKQFLCSAPHKARTSWDFCSCFKVCYCFSAVCHFLKFVIISLLKCANHKVQYLCLSWITRDKNLPITH